MSAANDGEAKDAKGKRKWPKKRKTPMFFEIGRVCLINYGEDTGKICVILDFVDSTRALIDGPKSQTGVRRQTIPFRRLSITPIKIKIIRACRSVHLEKAYLKGKVAEKWAKLPWAKKIERNKIRASLNDFDRFKVMVLKKKRSLLIRQKLNEIKIWRKQAAAYKPGSDEINRDNLGSALKLVKGFHRYHSGYKPICRKPQPLTEEEVKQIPLLNIPGKGFKIRPRSGKRSKKRSAARRAAASAYSKAMKFKRKQTARKVKREDKVRTRTRISRASKQKRKRKGLAKNPTEAEVKWHKIKYVNRRKKKKRLIKKARKAKERAAKKVKKEELATRKASPDYKPMKEKFKNKPCQRRKGEKWIRPKWTKTKPTAVKKKKPAAK